MHGILKTSTKFPFTEDSTMTLPGGGQWPIGYLLAVNMYLPAPVKAPLFISAISKESYDNRGTVNGRAPYVNTWHISNAYGELVGGVSFSNSPDLLGGAVNCTPDGSLIGYVTDMSGMFSGNVIVSGDFSNITENFPSYLTLPRDSFIFDVSGTGAKKPTPWNGFVYEGRAVKEISAGYPFETTVEHVGSSSILTLAMPESPYTKTISGVIGITVGANRYEGKNLLLDVAEADSDLRVTRMGDSLYIGTPRSLYEAGGR